MEEENEIDYKPKYDKEFTRRMKMPKTEISDIKINPVDPTYFYVFKIQTLENDTKIINYTATEDKFHDRMAEVREQERDSEDSDFDSDDDAMSGDLFEKTLAYMRNNKIYSVGKDGKAKQTLDTGVQGAGQDLNKVLSNRAMSRIDGATNQSRTGIRGRTKQNLRGLVPGFGTKKGLKQQSAIIEESGEDGSNSNSDETPLDRYSGSEESEESEESETPESSGEQFSNESSEEEGYDEESSEEDDEGGSRDSKHFEGGNSNKSSIEEPVGALNQPSHEVRVNEDSKALEEEAKKNQMGTEEPMIGADENIHRDSNAHLKAKDNAEPKKKKSGILSNLKNPLDMINGVASKNQKDGDAKEAGANQDQPEQDDDQIDKNATEYYGFERIRSENSGMVIKKFRNVLMCCKFEQYGYSIKQKLYADEMGNDVQGQFKFSSRMIFSSCGQYFATYTGNNYIIYQAKSLKMVKSFELNNFVEDVEYYYGNDDNKFLSSDAKYLASKNYNSIYVYHAYSNDAGDQVSQYTNMNVTFHGFMNSSYLIGVANEIDTSYITKVDVTNEEFRLEKINGSYYDEDITQYISNIKFNPKGKACAFVVNENVLYYLDLSRRNSTPQKVLERFDRIIYDVDSDRISMAYVQDNQGYIALYKNVFMFRKRYDNFYNLHSIDSDDNNEIIYIEGYGPYKTIHTFDEHNSSTIKFEPKIRFHYPFVFYEYERNELWFQNIEEKDIIHRFVFVNTVSALNCIDTVNTGFCYQNAPKLFIKLILSFEADHKIAYLDIDFDPDDHDHDEEDKILSANVTRYTKSIKFTELPNADILSFVEMTGKNEKNLTETCFLFHFPSQLKLYFFKSGKIKKSFEKTLQRRNIISFNKRTFFWEDKGRYIERMETDLPKDEKHYFYKAYDAKNVMKMCKKIDYYQNKECLLVCDEDKFVKILSYDEGNKKFDVEKEYYVNEMFGLYEDLDTLDTYYLTKGMLYKNDQTYLLQERGNEKVSN